MNDKIEARKYMEMAVKVMKDSIGEKRNDGKVVPYVGAVLINSEGEFVEKAHRGEIREGDHAEYTLLDKKLRDKDLTGHILFATLEPCALKSRSKGKTCCAKRIVNARISEVWVGVEDPDPTVARKGLEYLKQYGVKVHMFEWDLQQEIEEVNEEFLKQATERAEEADDFSPELSKLENEVTYSKIGEFSGDAFRKYEQLAKLPYSAMSEEFYSMAERKGIVKYVEEKYGQTGRIPTGMGLLLFGKNPRERYSQAVLKAEIRYGDDEPEIRDFDEPLVLIPDELERWLSKVLHSKIAREHFKRKNVTDFPIEVIREAVVNAIIHRDYDNENAKSYLQIDDNKIIVKSPGYPIKPISLQDLKKFQAPSLSRNPVLSHIFNQMGYAEERGIGMRTLKSLPEKYDLPLPQYSYEDPFLVLIFPRSFEAVKTVSGNEDLQELNDEELRGYEFIRTKDKITKKEYAEYFEYSDRQAERHLKKFKDLKLIKRKGAGPATYYKTIPT